MSVLILASVSTFLVILFATTAYVVNNGTFSKMRTDYDSKMQGIVSQMNNTEYKNYEKDRQNNAVLNRNLKNINTLQEDEVKIKNDLNDFKKTYSDNTNKFITDLTATTSNLNYLTEVVNNMPTAEQTQDILGLQSTTQNHENRIQGNESKLTSHTSFINNLSGTSLDHRNAIVSLSNQSTIYTSNIDYLIDKNQINTNKIHLQGLSNQTLSNNLGYLASNFTNYTRDSLNWMSYAHSNLYSNVIPTLNTINQNYVTNTNYNTYSNSVSQNLININGTLNDIPIKYAKSGDFNDLKNRTNDVESLTSTLKGQYDGIKTTYATIDDVLKIKLTATDNSNADRILTSTLTNLSGTVAGMKIVDDSLGRDISQNNIDISTLKSQYTGLNNAYSTIITKDTAGANTFKLNVNDTTNSKTAFQIVNGQAVLLDIKANGTTTLNNVNINATGTTNLSGTTTIDNKVPATQPWVQSQLSSKTNNTRFINNWSGDADGTSSQIADDTGSYKALMLAGNRSGPGGARNVQVYDDLTVSRNAQVNGSLNAGNLTLNGQQVATNTYANDRLSDAKNYANDRLGDAKNYANDKFNEANGYTTTKFNEANSYTNTKVSQIQFPAQNYNDLSLTGTTKLNGTTVLNDNKIQLRPGNDDNHVLGHRANNPINGNNIDGPVLTGCGGGALGLGKNCGNKSILEWTGNGVQINGGLKICDTNGQNCKNVLVEGNSIKLQSQANNRFIGNTNNWEGNGSDPNNPSGGYSCINANGWKCGITTLQVANAPNVNQNWTIYKN